MIALLKGEYEFVIKERATILANLYETPPTIFSLYQTIYAHIELYNGNEENCLDCIENVIELLPSISQINNSAYFSAILCLTAFYHILMGNSKTSGLKTSSFRPGKQNHLSVVTDPVLMRRYSQAMATEVEEESQKILKVKTGKRFSKGDALSPEAEEDAPKMLKGKTAKKFSRADAYSLRNSVNVQSDDTESSDFISRINRRKSFVELPDTLKRKVRLLGGLLLKAMAKFAGHSVYRPFELLIHGLSYEPGALYDTPKAMREWLTKNDENGDMRYLVAFVAMKGWRISCSMDWLAEKNMAKNIFEDLDLPETIKWGEGIVDLV